MIIQPGTVYGRGDHSAIGAQLKSAYDGTAHFVAFAGMGISPTHVDDAAAGIIAALDRGRLGEAYILTAANTSLGQAMAVAAHAAGRRLPRLRLPNVALRLASPCRAGWRCTLRLAAQLQRGRERIRPHDLLGEQRKGRRRARLRAA